MASKSKSPEVPEPKAKVRVTKAQVSVKAKVVTAPKKAAAEPKLAEHKKVQTAEGWKRAMLKVKRGEGKSKKSKG